MQMFSHNAAGFLSFGLGAIVLVLILMGVRHSGVRQRQLRWATDLASQSKKNLWRFNMISWKPVCLSLVGATLLLSGCAPGSFDPTFGVWPGLRAAAVEDRIVETTTICPPLVEYDPDFFSTGSR